MLVSNSVPNLLNGVSQQAHILRSPSQASEQINLDSDLKDGLTSRGGFQYISTIPQQTGAPPESSWFYHVIDYGPNLKYLLIITGSPTIKPIILDMQTGMAVTVNAIEDGYYSSNGKPARDVFKAITVSDHTFVVNTSVTVTNFMNGDWSLAKEYYPTFADVPTTGAVNTLYYIGGTEATQFNGYYLMWNATLNRYVEAAFNTDVLQNETLPHKIFQIAPGNFVWSQLGANMREIGDRVNNPLPSFVGRTIRDVFFFRNRLGFITSDSVVLSRAGDFFNFFRRTMTALLDDDPIDVTISHPRLTSLDYAVPYDNSMILFGNGAQFRFEGADILSPRAVRAEPAGYYEASARVRPISLGGRLYFAQEDGEYCRVLEYTPESDVKVIEAFDLTKHCPEYIRGKPMSLTGSATNGMIVLSTHMPTLGYTTDTCYVYRFHLDEDGKRVQSSWSKYQSVNTGTIRSAYLVYLTDSRLYGVLHNWQIGRARIEAIDMTSLDVLPGSTATFIRDSDGIGFLPVLDSMVVLEGTYNAVGNTTTWNLPWDYLNGSFHGFEAGWLKLVTTGKPNTLGQGGGTVIPNVQYNVASPGVLYAEGDWSTATVGKVIVGQPVITQYTLSKLFTRDDKGAARMGVKTTLRQLTFNVERTALLKFYIQMPGRDPKVREFQAVNSPGGVIGKPRRHTGPVKLTVRGKADETRIAVMNDSVFPQTITSFEWTGESNSIAQQR